MAVSTTVRGRMPYTSTDSLPANVKRLSPKRQRQWMAVWNSSFSACMARDEASSNRQSCESEAFAKANGVVKGAEMPNSLHEGAMLQLEKTDDRVNYRASDPKGWQCQSCRFFDAGTATCSLVEGTIDPTWTCDLWTPQVGASGAKNPDKGSKKAGEEPDFQLFMEVGQIFGTDLPDSQWIPFLPKPGKFKHPKYGEIEITPERNQGMVDSVKKKVYQEHIPLDAEHETKLSGALAWLKDMRMNADGSADAHVDWTDRGKALVGGGGYRYISPEWFTTWRDPATGVVHTNIVAGGAVTTRPFFKDSSLRALVASEKAWEMISPNPEGDKSMADDKDKDPKAGAETTLTMAEVETKIAAAVDAAKEATKVEFTQKMTELEGKVTAAEALAATEKTAREAATTQLAAMQTADREKRFRDMIAGRGGDADGAKWAGDADKHLAVLTKLAETFGEAPTKEGEAANPFAEYVENQKAIAAQLSEANLFVEVGTGGKPAAGSPQAKLDALVEAKAKTETTKSRQQVYAEVLETAEGQKLYGEIEASARR